MQSLNIKLKLKKITLSIVTSDFLTSLEQRQNHISFDLFNNFDKASLENNRKSLASLAFAF